MPRMPTFGGDVHSTDATPMSAARLAAEAAFGPAPLLAEAPQPIQAQVVVRRGRAAALTPAAAAVDEAGVDPSAPFAAKGPRVFRVEAAAMPVAMLTEPVPSPVAANSSGSAAALAPKGRLRRATADQRPGPVLHVVHTLPPRPAASPPLLPVGALAARLALVEPVLAEIRRAQALLFVDHSQAGEWQRLGRVADAIRLALRTMTR